MTTNTPTKPRRKKGRPTVFTTNTKKRLVRAIAAGVPMRMAAASCRVSYSGFCEYRNTNPKFEERIQKAVAGAVEWHLRNIISAAKNGDVQSSRWFLERTQPAHFGRTKIEVTGADGSPLAVGVGIYLPAKDLPDGKPLPASLPPPMNHEPV